MSNVDGRSRQAWLPGPLCVAVAAFFLCLVLLAPTPAAANTLIPAGTFGGVKAKGEESEEAQLQGVGAIAVNYTGAGGVPPGTVYAGVINSGGRFVVRFTPEAGGPGLKFVEAWQALSGSEEKANETSGQPPYRLCGKAVVEEGLTGEPTCVSRLKQEHEIGEPGAANIGLAVDQTTGNVYFSPEIGGWPVGAKLIAEYSANGSDLITRFGEKGPEGGGHTFAETPAQIHESPSTGYLAVNSAGEVLVADALVNDNFSHRVMVFKPTVAGDYSAYEYAGQARDIAAGVGNDEVVPQHPVVDSAGNVYVSDGEIIAEFDPASPSVPKCSFIFRPGGITSIAVNPESGELFFYTSTGKFKGIHSLAPCKDGEFAPDGETAVTPERASLVGLTYDPLRFLDEGGEPGVLYGAAPSSTPDVGPGEPGTSGLGYIFAQPVEGPPAITEEAVSQVTAESAKLSGQLNPNGFATEYAFQYLPKADFEAQGGGFAGAGEVGGVAAGAGARAVTATVTLNPDTAYVFRLVASSKCVTGEPEKACPAEGQPVFFNTYPIEALGPPDGRGYELVSPADKQGGQVIPAHPQQSSCSAICKPGASTAIGFPMQATPGGDAIVYEGEPFSSDGAAIENQYLSRWTPAGWTTVNLTPSTLLNRAGGTAEKGVGYKAFDRSLSSGVLLQWLPVLSPATPGEVRDLYVQSTASPSLFTPLVSSTAAPKCKTGVGPGTLELRYAGGSADLSQVFFLANDALTVEASGSCGAVNLYEWSGGSLRVVNILPGGSKSTTGAAFGSGELLRAGNPNNPSPITSHAVSDDGSRVFFTGANGHLYVRLNGSETLELPTPGNCAAATPVAQRVCFLTASSDGHRVLLSNGQIDELNAAGSAYVPGTDLSQGHGGFVGLAGQSESLNTVYFVDTAVLTAEDNDHGQAAEPGKANLYFWEGGTPSFVATLVGNDADVVAAAPLYRTAEASPSGRYLAFSSLAPLTGYDNVGCGASGSATCREVFLYDSQSTALTCASCNPSGVSPVGGSVLPTRPEVEIPSSIPQPYYLNDAGRLIFESGDRLVPADSNGKVEDLYEYELAEAPGCDRPDHCLSLLSGGRGVSDSNFLAMDEAGDNVFFTTRNRLVKADTDELIDVYDARVGGGTVEPAPPKECRGEGCQTTSSAPPLVTPSSMAVPAEAKRLTCRKGQVKRHGKCVKKPARAKKKHKKKRQGSKGGVR